MITKINVLPINGHNNCVAMVNFELEGLYRVSGIKLFFDAETNSHWVKYAKNPSNKKGACYFYPCNKESADELDKIIWNEYLKVKNTNGEEA